MYAQSGAPLSARRVLERGETLAICIAGNTMRRSASTKTLDNFKLTPTLVERHGNVPAHGSYCIAIKNKNTLSNAKQLRGNAFSVPSYVLRLDSTIPLQISMSVGELDTR